MRSRNTSTDHSDEEFYDVAVDPSGQRAGIVWLVPVGRREALYVREHGWRRFEEELERTDRHHVRRGRCHGRWAMQSRNQEVPTMRLTATEAGFFEDYESEEAIEVGVAGVDESGTPRSFSIQRSTYEPDEQEIQSGMDSYSVSTERGLTVYGCLRSVRLSTMVLTLEFTDEGADILEISTSVEVNLSEVRVDEDNLPRKLGEILDWGSPERRPELFGLDV